MEEQAKQQQKWWQKNKKLLMRIVLVALFAVVIVLIILIILGYILNWDWTGLNATDFTSTPKNITSTIVYQPGKTLWDWLQLLIIPAVLAVAGYVINLTISRGEQEATKQRDKTEHEIALDNQREATLQKYIDSMSELLLKEHLGELTVDGKLNPEYQQVRKIARVRTITILTQLDAWRIGSVFAVLREAGLMSTTSDRSVVSLKDADLRQVKWSQADLSQADLRGAHLREAQLQGADLNYAQLQEASLRGAQLQGAELYGAQLQEANLDFARLQKAELLGARLQEAFLHEAQLQGAFLYDAHLQGAVLSKAQLQEADLTRADLSGADLSQANLHNAKNITTEELENQAKSLKGATMPDGSIHD
jgi:uncharacterized protein YjbI with pentapeptide repeats